MGATGPLTRGLFSSGRIWRRRLSALLCSLALLLLLAPPGGATLAATEGDARADLSLLGDPKVATGSDDVISRIAPELMRKARQSPSDGTLDVLVVSDGPLAEPGILSSRAAQRPDMGGLTFTAGKVSPGSLVKLASADNIVTVLSNGPLPIPILPELEDTRARGPRPDQRPGVGVRGSGSESSREADARRGKEPTTDLRSLTPDSWNSVDVHKARSAWAQGYRGSGVNVAVLDTGVDFGHPDLQGTFARVENPASPYFGWPYALDPWSSELMSQGILLDVQSAIRGYGSWFADTSTVVRGTQALFTTVTATPDGMDPITHTYTLPGTSLSGEYHMGLHPDEHLAFDVYSEYVTVLVADTVTPGVYDTVYVDLNDNHDFRDDRPIRKGSEVYTLDQTGDGLADLSAGMVYYVADGRNTPPAADWLFGVLPPGNGDVVAFQGSMDYNQDHGTFCASSVVAQGRIDGQTEIRPPYKPQGVGGMVQGMAPDARVVAIGNIYRSGASIYNAMRLAAVGGDGQPNSGDEPQIASMSFGTSGAWNNGWDFMSRYLVYLSRFNPRLTWMASTGNGGYGYGTVTAPASSPAVIAVGAATQYGETLTFEQINSADRITSGDVQPWSNRGPSHMGQPKPDVVAVGAWGVGDRPVNISPRNGSTAYELWGGTSMSTPIGAGIAALVYQAYRARTGSWPDAETVRTLLKSSATDLNYGPFVQGAGMLDAGRAVTMARGQSGLAVSPSSWVPGTTAPASMGALLPGESATQTLQLQNLGGQATTARVSAERLVETSTYEWNVLTDNAEESGGSISRPDYVWNLRERIPPDTDLVRVSAVISFTEFSLANPRSPFLGVSSAWRLLAYEWNDDNRNGAAFRDLNANGAVNDGELDSGEINRLTYVYNTHDIVELMVQKPLARAGDGFLVGLQHSIRSNNVPRTNMRLKLTTYRRAPWPMLTTPGGQVSIPARGSVPVSVSAQVPAGTAVGAYEGSIVVETGTGADARRIVVPVALNVRARSLPSTFGGANRPPANTPFDNGRTFGGQDWRWRPESAEWRHYYLDNRSQPGANTFLWAGVEWQYFPTDFDLVIGGPTPWDWFSQRYPELYGPNGMDGLAGSEWTNLGGGDWSWKTRTDTTEEWVSARLGQTGTHEAVIHNVFYSGSGPSESYTATLGTVRLSRDYIDITSSQRTGSAQVSLTTDRDLPGLRAEAYGLAQKRMYPNQRILPLQTWFTETDVVDVASVEFYTEAPPDTNVDIYVDYFENGRFVWVGSSTGPTGQEFVRVEPARSGRYRVRVEAARDVPNPARFDYGLKAIAGRDLTVSPAAITDTIPAGSTVTFTVTYDRPSMTDGVWDGRLFLGPYKAPSLHSLRVTVYYGNITPTPSPTPTVCRSRFTDVPQDHWSYQYVNPLWCRGVISGYWDETFRPGAQASRVQFAKMIVLGMGWPLEHPETPTFTDVPELSWGYEFIETALERGAINGYSDGTFRPVNPITRGQIAKILVLAKGWEPVNSTTSSFSDVARDNPFFTYIEAGVSRGILSGYSDRTFRPGVSATRAQLSKMLYLAMEAED